MGFEHEGAVNADTQRLVLEWIAHHAPWPASVRIELRLGEAGGRVLAAKGAASATEMKTIITPSRGTNWPMASRQCLAKACCHA